MTAARWHNNNSCAVSKRKPLSHESTCSQEFEKWINCRVKTELEKVKALAVSATDKKSVIFAIGQFLHVSRPYDVLISKMLYNETFILLRHLLNDTYLTQCAAFS